MMRTTHALALAVTLLLADRALAQSRESRSMLPPSPFDSQNAPQKLTPPPPPPWDEPLSTSGTDVEAPLQTPPLVQQPPAHDGSSARIRDLERRISELEHEHRGVMRLPHWVAWLHPSLLLQPQLIWNFYNAAASPNAQGGVLPPGIGSNDVTATPTGNTTNPDFLRLRRARLKLDFVPSEYARFVFEFEPVPRDPTVPGSGIIAREIEAIGRFPLTKHVFLDLGGGSFEVPLGGEWREYHGDRPFIERSWFQQNVLPGDFDLGLHMGLYAGHHVELELATVNGRTFGELDQQGGNLDLNRAKDVVAAVRLAFTGVDVGASGYAGVGQLVDGINLRFKQYARYAGDVDLAVHHKTRFGSTRAFLEGFVGANMDRGVLSPGNLPVIPVDITQDVTDRVEFGALVRIDQDLGRFFTVAARYDVYIPDVNLDDDMRHTLGAVLVLHLVPELEKVSKRYLFDPRLQVNFEYDHAIDTIRASGPVPATKEIDTLSLVLQGRL
jgi:hypothetical protein